MTNEELNTALYEKLFAEQQDFKGWLVKQPPEEILTVHTANYEELRDLAERDPRKEKEHGRE